MNVWCLVLLTSTSVSCFSVLSPDENRYQLVEDVIKSLESVIGYYKKRYRDMNLDGVFGLKIAEGQTGLILSSKERFKIPPAHLARIQNIYISSVNLSSLAIPHLKRADEAYFHRAGRLLRPWRVWVETRDVDEKLVWNTTQLDFHFQLNETVSDLCMGELVAIPTTCNLSKPCVDVMLRKRGTRGYTITHQVLYAHLVHLVGCTAPVNRLMSRHSGRDQPWTLSRWENELCANILASMTEKLVAEMGILTHQDLFIEELFVCGVLGFSVFLRPSFARKILMWQDKSGCFAPMEGHKPMKNRPRRALLEEKDLSDGCLAHKTSVALGTLSALLHQFIESDVRSSLYIPPSQKRAATRPPHIPKDAQVIDPNGVMPYKSLTIAETKPPSISLLQWTFPLMTVFLTLVLLWRVKAVRLCRRQAMYTERL